MKKVWLVAFWFWVVASALACWLYPIMIFDACNRYAPMASAVASGDWAHAFHPRFGILFQLVSGALAWVTGLEGRYAVQIAAILFLALSGVAMFALAKTLTKSERIAWWTLALVLLAPDFYRFALDGLREPIKCLVFALLGYGAITRRGWVFGWGLFIYITSFVYGFAAASALLLGWVGYLVYLLKADGGGIGRSQFLAAVLTSAIPYALGVVSASSMVYAYTGYFVPAMQFISLLGGEA